MKRQIIVVVSMLLVLAACSPAGQETQAKSGGAGNLSGTSWTLSSFKTDHKSTPVIGEGAVTIQFQNGSQVIGQGGCNSYGATYQINGDKINFDDFISTMIACEQIVVIEQEERFYTALRTAESLEATNETLNIEYDGGQGVLTFTAVDQGIQMLPARPYAYHLL